MKNFVKAAKEKTEIIRFTAVNHMGCNRRMSMRLYHNVYTTFISVNPKDTLNEEKKTQVAFCLVHTSLIVEGNSLLEISTLCLSNVIYSL